MVKLPGSFTSNTNNRGLVDEEVYERGPIWENKVLVELENDEVTPVMRNGHTVAMERDVQVSLENVYTDTSTHEPLPLVACEPGYVSDDEEFTESMAEMQACLEREMDDEQKMQREERIRKRQAEQNKAVPMDTMPAHTDPAAIPGTQLHVLPPKGAVMADFSNSGKVTVDLTQSVNEEASTGNTGGQATDPQGATGGGRAGTAVSDAQLAAEVNIYKSLDDMCRDLNILEAGYFKCVDETRGVINEVSTHLDALENTYMASVMAALAKWQEFGAEGPAGHAHG